MDTNLCLSYKNDSDSMLVLDGKAPEHILEPKTEEEVLQVLSYANKNILPLAIFGGGSKFSLGAPIQDVKWVVSTKRLHSEPNINIDDLIVVCKTGVQLKELQDLLAQKGLFFPADPGIFNETIGGLIACGGGDSHRMGYGLICDSVLGMRVVLPNGNIYRFGGTTVKNVAGYDVGKLFIGSKGTLGLITEVNLRVYALPPTSAMLVIHLKERSHVGKTVQSLMELQPTVLEVYDSSSAKKLLDTNEVSGFFILVKYSGPIPSVDKQVQETMDFLNRNNFTLIQSIESNEQELIWKKRAELLNCCINKDNPNSLSLKAVVSPVKINELADELQVIADDNSCRLELMYMPGVGIAYGTVEGDALKKYFQDVEAAIKGLNGLLHLQAGPISIRQEFYNKPWRDWDLKVKNFFDPNGILNPGKRP